MKITNNKIKQKIIEVKVYYFSQIISNDYDLLKYY